MGCKKTHNLITNLLSSGDVNSLTKMIILNTIYFKAKWKYSFNKNDTYKEIFHSLSKDCQIEMMHKTHKYLYSEDNLTQYIQIPYINEKYALIIALPRFNSNDISRSIVSLQANMSQPGSFWTHQFMSEKVSLSIPKFTHRQKLSLVKVLKNLGVNDAFTGKADFSIMSPDAPIQISDVIHEAIVKIDEEGTEATAATAVTMRYFSAITDSEKIIDFHANHTFYYAIVSIPEKLILFNGVFDN